MLMAPLCLADDEGVSHASVSVAAENSVGTTSSTFRTCLDLHWLYSWTRLLRLLPGLGGTWGVLEVRLVWAVRSAGLHDASNAEEIFEVRSAGVIRERVTERGARHVGAKPNSIFCGCCVP